jgi:universal stress protein A
MAHYKRLLVAVDFSDQSVRALQVARDLGNRLNAGLDIVHFVPVRIIGIDMEGMEAEATYIEELHKNDLDEARAKLEKFIEQHTSEDDDIEHHLYSGEPTNEINTRAREIGADMIIIGTHGRSGLKHILLGSVAESVLRTAEIPVLCVRSG